MFEALVLILLAGILVVGIFNWQRNSSIARKLDRMLERK